MSNLGITQKELDYIIGASLSVKDAIATFLQTPHTVHQASHTSFFRISLCVPQLILLTLLDQGTISDVNIELLQTDPYSPSIADDLAWVLQDLDLTAPFHLQLSHHRQFVCGYFVPLFIRLCTLSSGVLEEGVAVKLVNGMPYFHYLAVRLGFGNVSQVKRTAWSTFIMSRKVEIMSRKIRIMWGTTNGISAVGETDAVMAEVDMRLQKVIEKIQVDGKQELTKLQEALIATHTEIAQNKISVDKNITKLQDGLIAVDNDFTKLQENKITVDKDITKLQVGIIAVDKDITKLQVGIIAVDKDITKLQEGFIAVDNDITKLQGDLITMDTEIAQNKIAVGNDMSEMKEALSSLQNTLEIKLIANINLNLAIHTDVITSKMDQFLSATLRQPVPATQTVPIVPSDHCDLQVFLRLRNGTPIIQDLVSNTTGIHREFISGEPTDLISRAVTRGLTSSTPFIVAVAGFSGGGKSFNMFSVGGLLETILCYLPDVEIAVNEVLTGMKYLCGFQHSRGFQHSGGASVLDICNKISHLRTTRPTPANTVSSRTHAVVSFEDQHSGRLYDVLLDVAGDEQSSDRALMNDEKSSDRALINDEKVVSDNIALNNADWHMMIREVVTPGKGLGGFVRGGASNYKRASKLNTEVSNFLVRMVGQKAGEMPVLRVLYCLDGSCDAVVTKTLNQIKELGELAK